MSEKKLNSNKKSAPKAKSVKSKANSKKDYASIANANDNACETLATYSVGKINEVEKSLGLSKKKKGGAPKGNKYALGHGFGRPKEIDYEQEGRWLLEWIDETADEDATHFVHYCAQRGISLDAFYSWPSQSEIFSQAYVLAKTKIYANQMKFTQNNKHNFGVWSRYAFMYDPALHEAEKAKKQFEADLAKKVEDNKIESQLEQFNAIMERKYKEKKADE